MTHTFPIRVYYEDTDMGGIVYHANYLRYIERARSDWVRNLGNDQNAMRDAGIVWVVRKIEAEYLAEGTSGAESTGLGLSIAQRTAELKFFSKFFF